MNEHLYGPGRGIALSPGFIEATTIGDWSLKPSVAILDGQLFLSVRQEFWGPQPAVHGLPGLQMLREWWQSGGARMPSRTHMEGHCDLCLTDYTVRMRRNQDPVPQQPTIRDLEYDAEAHSLNPRGRRNGLLPNKTDVDVEIVTYHQLGAFRTPQDWMWRAFTERTTEFQEEHMSFLYAGHAPGSVKKRWERGVAAKRKQIRASGKTSA
ncbi:DNA repair helicase RAD25 [Apiospora arundinis]